MKSIIILMCVNISWLSSIVAMHEESVGEGWEDLSTCSLSTATVSTSAGSINVGVSYTSQEEHFREDMRRVKSSVFTAYEAFYYLNEYLGLGNLNIKPSLQAMLTHIKIFFEIVVLFCNSKSLPLEGVIRSADRRPFKDREDAIEYFEARFHTQDLLLYECHKRGRHLKLSVNYMKQLIQYYNVSVSQKFSASCSAIESSPLLNKNGDLLYQIIKGLDRSPFAAVRNRASTTSF